MRHIAALINQALAAGPKWKGTTADVYLFPAGIGNLQDYVIRRVRKSGIERVAESSALTPPAQLIPGMDVAQPLLVLDGQDDTLQILRRQPGEPVASVREARRRDEAVRHPPRCAISKLMNRYRADHAMNQTLLSFAGDGKNPFEPVLDETYRMGLLGYQASCHELNRLIDTQGRRLRLVDQRNPGTRGFTPAQQAESNLERMALSLQAGLRHRLAVDGQEAFCHEYNEVAQPLYGLLTDACRTVRERYAAENAPPVCFAKTDSVKALALTASPKALRDHLQAIEKLAALPAR